MRLTTRLGNLATLVLAAAAVYVIGVALLAAWSVAWPMWSMWTMMGQMMGPVWSGGVLGLLLLFAAGMLAGVLWLIGLVSRAIGATGEPTGKREVAGS